MSAAGHLGVVSGTALDLILARRLQLGDPGGHMRRALAAFPFPGVADHIIERYYVEGGKDEDTPFINKPMLSDRTAPKTVELLVAGNFVEVWLAKEGHSNPVGINFLEKIQVPNLASMYGSMLADVDYVLMGAGIPRAIPGFLDRLSEGLDVEMQIDVKGTTADGDPFVCFSPKSIAKDLLGPLKRPEFFAIVSTHVLAKMLSMKSTGEVNGFIVELPVAGGHNAPPRKKGQFNDIGEPIYGDRDVPDFEAIKALGKPFWIAGGYAEPAQIKSALEVGAAGVQVGTAFAYCNESGFTREIKDEVIELSRRDQLTVFTDGRASPTGFPFKVVELDETSTNPLVYESRERICDLGYLRHGYQLPNGKIGWRCPSEPVEDYVRKGGDIADTVGRKCVCNALTSNIGQAQVKTDGTHEPMLITSGDDAANVARFAPEGSTHYSACDVIDYLLDGVFDDD